VDDNTLLISWKFDFLRNYLKFFLITQIMLILIFLFPSYSFAKEIELPYLWHTYKNDISYSANQINNNWKLALGVAALVGASFFADNGIKSYSQKHRSSFMDHFTNDVKPFGNGFVVLPAALGLGAIGYYSKNDKLLDASFTSVESIITADAITGVIKVTAGRSRPNNGHNHAFFKPFNMDDKYQSFPSGDVTTAWAFVTPYAIYYHQPLLYLIPISIGVERIYKNEHWFSDTVASSVIGFFTAYLFSESHLSNSNFSIFADERYIGVSYRFK